MSLVSLNNNNVLLIPEILEMVFEYFPNQTKWEMGRVCKDWYFLLREKHITITNLGNNPHQIYFTHLTRLHSLKLFYVKSVSSVALNSLVSHSAWSSSLRKLSLNSLKWTCETESLQPAFCRLQQLIEFFGYLPPVTLPETLTRLTLLNQNVSSIPLTHLTNLRSLDIRNVQEDTDVKRLTVLTHLSTLKITVYKISELSVVTQLQHLTVVDRRRNRQAPLLLNLNRCFPQLSKLKLKFNEDDDQEKWHREILSYSESQLLSLMPLHAALLFDAITYHFSTNPYKAYDCLPVISEWKPLFEEGTLAQQQHRAIRRSIHADFFDDENVAEEDLIAEEEKAFDQLSKLLKAGFDLNQVGWNGAPYWTKSLEHRSLLLLKYFYEKGAKVSTKHPFDLEGRLGEPIVAYLSRCTGS